MDDLKALVKELRRTKGDEAHIRLLQAIGDKLVTEYVLQIDDTVIEPLRVEAYYYPFAEEGTFDDKCAHPSSKKIGNFGKLYFIEERYGYPGVDLCLSDGKYYLSYLIKNSKIGDSYFKQMDLYEKFQPHWAEIEEQTVLHKIPDNGKRVFHTARVGLNEGSTKYFDAPLASVVDIKGTRWCNFEKNHGKEWTAAYYLVEHCMEPTAGNIQELIGYRSKKVKELCEAMQKAEK